MITTGKWASFWNGDTIILRVVLFQVSASDHLFWRSQEVRLSRIAKGGIRNLSRPSRGTSLKPLTRGEGFRRTATSPRGVPGFKPYTCIFPSQNHTHLEGLSHSFISTIQLSNIHYQTLPTPVLATRYTSRLEGIPDLPPPLTCCLLRGLTPFVFDISIRAYQFPRQIGRGDTTKTSSILTPERLSS
jgi:hypothetical protein